MNKLDGEFNKGSKERDITASEKKSTAEASLFTSLSYTRTRREKNDNSSSNVEKWK